MPIDLQRLNTGGAYAGPLAKATRLPETGIRELAAGERVGVFEIDRELSRGGMGIVYLAHRADGEFAQRVALKWMSGARDRSTAEVLFRRERDILASLEHPGISRLIDGGRTSDQMLWFAMEFVEGEAIDRWCAARGVDRNGRVRLVLELIEALDFAHRRLLIHRDIKPANVLVDTNGRARLLDFGIARLTDQRDLLGAPALTPGYASPEQWANDEVTVASDVYQTGLLLAATLEALPRPPPRSHVTRTASETSNIEPAAIDAQALRGLPPDLAAIITKATAINPAERYSSVAALGEDLRRWIDHRPVLASQGGMTYRTGRLLRRHPWASAASVAALLALIAMGWLLAAENHRAQEQARRAVAEAARTRGALDFLTGLLQWADPRNHGGERIAVDQALDRGIVQLDELVKNQPLLRAELQQTLGGIYLMREDLQRATPLLLAARAEFARHSELAPERRARNAIDLAIALNSTKADEARALLGDAIALLSANPAQAQMRIEARRHLATEAYRQGDLIAARGQLQAALLEAERHLPPDAAEFIPIRNNLAGYLGDLGDHGAALLLKEQNLEAARAAYGDIHPSTSLARTTLARTLLALSRVDDAEVLIVQDGDARVRMWGTGHTQYGVHLQNRARLLLRRGEIDAARAQITRAIAISRRNGDSGFQHLASQLANLAEIELRSGNPGAAEQALVEALSPTLQRSAVVKDLGARRLLLVQALRANNRFDTIAAELRTIDQEMKPLPDDHPRRGSWLIEQAWLAHHQQQSETARQFVRRARSLLETTKASAERDDAIARLAQIAAL